MNDLKAAGFSSREEAIIARARRMLGGNEAPDRDDLGSVLTGLSKHVAPGDDCAVWHAGAFDLLATTDMLVEGTHFLLPDRENHLRERILALDALGWKSLAVNISDIAACGGEPLGYLVGLGIPADARDDEIEAFTAGLARAAARYRAAIWGGDLVKSNDWSVSVTATGAVPAGRALTRRARACDDIVLVSGYVGLAAIGVEVAENAAEHANYPEALKRLATPDARLELGIALRERGLAGAMIDTSDSLAKSIRLIAERSGFGVVADTSSLSLHPDVERYLISTFSCVHTEAAVDFLFAAAEDFELVFTAKRDDTAAITSLAASLAPPLPISAAATIEPNVKLRMIRGGRRYPWKETGFEHFTGGSE